MLTSVNGELTQQVQREFFGHTLILNPMSEEGMRSPLLVFAALSFLRKGLGGPAGMPMVPMVLVKAKRRRSVSTAASSTCRRPSTSVRNSAAGSRSHALLSTTQ